MNIASALNVKKRRDGFVENGDYIVTWCIGHLAALANAEAYDEALHKWELAPLPILPGKWQYSVCNGKEKQFQVLCTLMNRSDVTEIINACDAGREGELIFRTVYLLANCKKIVKRLWISSMEEKAIREGVAELRDSKDYDGMYRSALCRAKADWLVGINASRFFSLLYHRKLNIGRVMSPTLAMIVQRESEISAFTPEPFYTVELDLGSFTAVSERLADSQIAERTAAECKGKQALVQAVVQKEHAEKAPLPYDLTTLQRDANRLLGYTAQQTLDYLQSLYEKKLCTYPRSDSRYLTDDIKKTVPKLVRAAAAICQIPVPEMIHADRVCCSDNVTDHFAIIPTETCAKADLSSLPAGERAILRLLSLELLMSVCGDHRYTETEVTVSCENREFTVKGKAILEEGWKRYAEKSTHTSQLPEVKEGQSFTVTDTSEKEGKTTPPKHFSEDTLLAAMENVDTSDSAERKGIGTPATRAGIIEKLISAGFIERRSGKRSAVLIPTALGSALITVLPEELQSTQLTAEWEEKLSLLEKGVSPEDEFLGGISEMLRELIADYKPVDGAEILFREAGEAVGVCPRCGKMVREAAKGFFCENRDCSFALWKNSRFFTAKRKQLTAKAAAALLKEGRVRMKGCFSEKTGKLYDVDIVMTDNGSYTSFALEF